MNYIVNPAKKVEGVLNMPSDKSISHRAAIFSSMCEDSVQIQNFLFCDDTISTLRCLQNMGIDIQILENNNIKIFGKGMYGFDKPQNILDVGNSATTLRLLSGILVAQKFSTTLIGDESISKRPMNRIVEPLSKMGANISSNNGYAPIKIEGKDLMGIEYTLPVASAQVKSAIILAGLYANSETIVCEKNTTRNHTEILLSIFGANIFLKNRKIITKKTTKMMGNTIHIFGDISSASFFIVAALILEKSELLIRDICVNFTRTGLIDVLIKMGADISLINKKIISGELICDIVVKKSNLKCISISSNIIPRIIDEIPILCVACLFAEGKSILKDLEELKYKESNRIDAIVSELGKLGAKISKIDDNIIIEGKADLKEAELESYNDHRIAMSLVIAGLKCKSSIKINNIDCIKVSFPNFFEKIQEVCVF